LRNAKRSPVGCRGLGVGHRLLMVLRTTHTQGATGTGNDDSGHLSVATIEAQNRAHMPELAAVDWPQADSPGNRGDARYAARNDLQVTRSTAATEGTSPTAIPDAIFPDTARAQTSGERLELAPRGFFLGTSRRCNAIRHLIRASGTRGLGADGRTREVPQRPEGLLEVGLTSCDLAPLRRGFSAPAAGREMDQRDAREKLKRALQALNVAEKQMAELEDLLGYPQTRTSDLGSTTSPQNGIGGLPSCTVMTPLVARHMTLSPNVVELCSPPQPPRETSRACATASRQGEPSSSKQLPQSSRRMTSQRPPQ
jgi:hypothetical protein